MSLIWVGGYPYLIINKISFLAVTITFNRVDEEPLKIVRVLWINGCNEVFRCPPTLPSKLYDVKRSSH